MRFDHRTRVAEDIVPVDINKFHRETVPSVSPERMALAGRALSSSGLDGFTIAVDGCAWTWQVDANGMLEIVPGDIELYPRADLNPGRFSDIVNDVLSCSAVMVAGEQVMTRGRIGHLISWNPALRALIAQSLVRSTSALTQFHSGVKDNVIPNFATAAVNFRLLPGVTTQDVIDQVKKIIKDPEIEVSAKILKPGIMVSDHHHKGYETVKSVVSDSLPNALVVPGLLSGTTDTPYYANLTKNIYRFHPIVLDMEVAKSIHGNNERISIQSADKAAEMSRALISAAGSN